MCSGRMRGDLKRLLLADSLVRVGMRLYMTFTPLCVLNVLKRGYVEWGSLRSLVAVTSIMTYIPAAMLADRAGRHSRRPFIAATFHPGQRYQCSRVSVVRSGRYIVSAQYAIRGSLDSINARDRIASRWKES